VSNCILPIKNSVYAHGKTGVNEWRSDIYLTHFDAYLCRQSIALYTGNHTQNIQDKIDTDQCYDKQVQNFKKNTCNKHTHTQTQKPKPKIISVILQTIVTACMLSCLLHGKKTNKKKCENCCITVHMLCDVSRPTQPSIPPGSVNEYQLRLGRQRQVWLIPLADERGVCR